MIKLDQHDVISIYPVRLLKDTPGFSTTTGFTVSIGRKGGDGQWCVFWFTPEGMFEFDYKCRPYETSPSAKIFPSITEAAIAIAEVAGDC